MNICLAWLGIGHMAYVMMLNVVWAKPDDQTVNYIGTT